MLKNTINLNNWNKPQMRKWLLDSFDVIFTDCDGVLWHDDTVIPGTPDTINNLIGFGKQIFFVTNNGTKTRHDLWQKTQTMNYNITEEQIIAPTFSIAHYLKTHLKPGENVYVVGSSALTKELNNLHIPNFGVGPDVYEGNWTGAMENFNELTSNSNVGAVVIGFDDHYNFLKIAKASHFLVHNEECLFLATNSDAVHKFPQYCIPGTGALLKGIETCAEREALVMGKPNPLLCRHIMETEKMNPQRTLMIGDCYKVDVLFGKQCNFQTLLVGSGRYKWPDVEQIIMDGISESIPDFYINSLGDLFSCD